MKTCTKCGETKPKSEFPPRPERPCAVGSKCRACKNKSRVAHAKAHPEQKKASQSRAYRKRRAREALLPPEEQERLREEHAARATRWRDDHPGKNAASVAKWADQHPGKAAARRASELRATPAWANEFFVEEAYALAKLRTEMTGIEWHVDHIVPLRGKTVCGLHVENNLQVITAKANQSKGNYRWPDMPEPAPQRGVLLGDRS